MGREEGFSQWRVRGQKGPVLPTGLELAHCRAGGRVGVADSKERPPQPSLTSHLLLPSTSCLPPFHQLDTQ